MHITKEICNQLTDSEIVKKALADIDYFSCLYDRYEMKLMRYIRRIAAVSQEEAEDILGESFIKIWRNLNDFDQDMKLSSWIYRIVHNETVSYWRKQVSFGKDKQVELEDYHYEDGTVEVDDRAADKLKHQETHKILDMLPLKYKTVLILKFIEGMDYEEISDVLKMPEGTVATRINRAKKAFAKIAADKNISFFE